jgi:hypothetical protein
VADAVVDTTVLIALARLGRIDLLPRLYERVLAPDVVYREALSPPARADNVLIRQAFDEGDIDVVATQGDATAEPQVAGLGAGEAAAITLARALGAVVVLDDRRARRAARSLGLRVIGSVGLLVQARRGGLIPAVLPLVHELEASGFRIGPRELEAARAADDR